MKFYKYLCNYAINRNTLTNDVDISLIFNKQKWQYNADLEKKNNQ